MPDDRIIQPQPAANVVDALKRLRASVERLNLTVNAIRGSDDVTVSLADDETWYFFRDLLHIDPVSLEGV